MVLVLSPSPGLDLPPLNPGSTVGSRRGLLADGVGPLSTADRVPTHLDSTSVRAQGAAASAAVQFPPPSGAVPVQFKRFVVSANVHAPLSESEPHSSASADTSVASASFTCPLCGSSCVRSFGIRSSR